MRLIIGCIFLMVSFSAFSASDNSTNLLEERLFKQRIAEADHLSFIPYRENYLIYSKLLDGVNQNPIDTAFPNEEHSFRDYELQFQFSFMVPIAVDMFDSPVSLYVAYTNRSFWQLFDIQDSKPFRETNHEPEIWLSYFYDLKWGEFNAPMIWLGLNHQSNGQYENLSRGWNRIFIKAFFDYRRYSFSIIHWNHLKEGDPIDDQYKYEKFIGSGEISVDYAFSKNDLSLTYAYSLEGSEFGSITLEFAHPITDSLALYLRYFDGYGESLIDFDYESRTLSAGVKLNEW